MSKEFKGVWIPLDIYQDRLLNPTDKLILSDIAALPNYFKSNLTTSIEVGVSKRTAQRTFKKLELLGYITTTLDGRNRVAKLTTPIDKMTTYHSQNGHAERTKWPHSIQDSIHSSIQLSKRVIYPYQEKEFLEAWTVWLSERKDKKLRKYTDRGEQAALHNLQKISNNDYKKAVSIINNSITHGWQGLFPSREQKGSKFETTQNTIDWINKKR
jgi:hypothetical protein